MLGYLCLFCSLFSCLAYGYLDYRDYAVRQQALNVVADVPGLGEAGRVTDDEGDVEVGSQAADEVGCPSRKV